MAKGRTQPFFVSFGAEEFFLDRDLNRARAWKDRVVIPVEGDEVTDAELVSLCETVGMDATPRLVLLDNAQKVKGDKELKAYIDTKSPTDDFTVLVAIVRAEKLPEVWSRAAKKGRLFEHKKLKTYDTNNEVVKWIGSEALRLELGLDKGVADYLFTAAGGDLHRIAGELAKLQAFVGKGRKVTMEQLKLVVAPRPVAEPWHVAEAVVERDAKKALNLLSVVYRNMGEEAHVPLSFSLIKQVEKLLVARSMLDQKASEEEIAVALGMHPWRCKTHFIPQVKKHTLGGLISCLGDLRKLDVDVKGSARSKRTRVELAVLALITG